MIKDVDDKINKELDRFLDVCSIEEMFNIAKDAVPLVELHEMMEGYELIDDEEEKQEVSAQLFVRVIYLLSKFAHLHAGKLCVIKSVFPDLHKRLENITVSEDD